MNTLGSLQIKCDKLYSKNQKLGDKNLEYRHKIQEYKNIIGNRDKKVASLQEELAQEKSENTLLKRELQKVSDELAYLKAIMNHDSTTVGYSTAKTPIGKNKYNPNKNNLREKTGRKVGGQPGHEKNELKVPDIIDEEYEDVRNEDSRCPSCHSDQLIFTGSTKVTYESTVEVVRRTTKTIHYEYKCGNCGSRFYLNMKPEEKRSSCHYGSQVKAIALSLMNTCNVPINKVRTFFEGITDGSVLPCEGYIATLQRKAARNLAGFRESLRLFLIKRSIVYWDDTVIFVDTNRACLRFYGDEKISYYMAHDRKDLDGIVEDKVLDYLDENQTVMHDHNKVNYNERFFFNNIECNQHLQRDLKKNAEDTGHDELLELKKLISNTIHKRKLAISNGKDHFSDEEINAFDAEVSNILIRAQKRNEEDKKNIFKHEEEILIKRIREYYPNYFAWVRNFEFPTTDNLSEAGLRTIKSKQKISGQFKNIDTAQYYADIKTYIETCRKNGINEYYALQRLCNGNPLTVEEIFSEE